MSHRNSKATSSPVTRPLHSARVSSKALSRSAQLKSSSDKARSVIIPNPAKPARATKGAAHIVSFADAKRSMAPNSEKIGRRGEPRGAHASIDLSDNRKSKMQKLADNLKPNMSKAAEKPSKKKLKLPAIPFGKRRDKEFVIPAGKDLTSESTDFFGSPISPSTAPDKSAPVSRSLSAHMSASAGRDVSESRSVAAGKSMSARSSVAFEEPLPNTEGESAPSNRGIKGMLESKKEKAASKKRLKAKEKANKKFDKVYGGESKSSAVGQAGPRAALYSTKMGSSHKKSAKMQIKDAREMASHSMGIIGDKLSDFSLPELPKFATRILTMVAILAVFGFGLYGPAQQYYVQMRETDRLHAEFVEVAERTNNLADSIDSLHTKEGIEDKAHADLGYVKAGEKSATVKGIAQVNLLDLPTSNVAPGSIHAPDTWYSGFLDVLFGYSG